MAKSGTEDWILCQITSNAYSDPFAIEMTNQDFSIVRLRNISYVRPGKIFTANKTLIVSNIGNLKIEFFTLIVDSIISILRAGIAE